MTNSGYYPEVIAAAVDIIGMKNLLKKDDKLENVTKIIGQLCGNIDNNPKLKIHWRQFGDSAYLIGNPKDKLNDQLIKLSLSVASLTALGIFGENLIGRNFLLRSGISKGDLSSAQWDMKKDPFFMGNSMANAYILKDSQEWFGCCIAKDIDCNNIQSEYIIKYDEIPLKDGKYQGYAINWIEAAKQNKAELKIKTDINFENVSAKIEEISERIGYSNDKGKAIAKVNNTKKFVKHCLK